MAFQATQADSPDGGVSEHDRDFGCELFGLCFNEILE